MIEHWVHVNCMGNDSLYSFHTLTQFENGKTDRNNEWNLSLVIDKSITLNTSLVEKICQLKIAVARCQILCEPLKYC